MDRLVERITSDALEALRGQTDALAAEVASTDIARKDFIDDESEATKERYRQLIDPQKVHHAQRFFETFGLQIGAALLYKALPDTYAAARGAQVLYLTGELVSTPARRVRETAQLVLTIMQPPPDPNDRGATTLSPGRDGAVAARRIRMFHQDVRNLITSDHGDRWKRIAEYFELEVAPNGPRLGQPLNQEDLIGTLHEFTVGVFEALELLGVPYTEDDKAAWFHVWNVVGCHMGVGTRDAFGAGGDPTAIVDDCRLFLPLDPERSHATLEVIRQRHHMASVEGTILVNSLLAELQRPLQRGLKPFPASLMRYVLGDRAANLLGISRGGWLQQVLLSLDSVPRVAEIVRRRRKGSLVRLATSELSAITTQQLLHSYIEEGLSDGKPFALSAQLGNTWGLVTEPQPTLATPFTS